MPNSNMTQNKSACWWEMHISRNWNDNLGTALNKYMPHSTMTGNSQNDVYAEGSVGSFNDDIDSIVTGPSCWLELFEDTNFKGHQLNIGPNSAIRRLKDFVLETHTAHTDYWDNKVSSYRAYRTQPQGWAESTPASGAISHRFAVDKRDDSVMKLLGDAVSTALLAVPGADVAVAGLTSISVGSVLSSAFDTIWPTGSLDTRVHSDLKLWVQMAVYRLGFTVEEIFDDTKLDNIRDALNDCFQRNSDGTRVKDASGNPVILVENFKTLLDVWINPTYNYLTEMASSAPSGWQVNSLHFMAEFAAIAAICWRASLYLDFGTSDGTQSDSKTALSKKLPNVLSFISGGMEQVRTARTNQVVAKTHQQGTTQPGITIDTYYWEDQYTGLSCNHKYSSTQERDEEQSYYISNILQPNLLNDWDGFQQLCDALEYYTDLSSDAPGKIAIPRQTVKSLTGMWADAPVKSASNPVVLLEFNPDEVADLSFNSYQDSTDNEGHACLGLQPFIRDTKGNLVSLGVIGKRTGSSTSTSEYGLTDRYQAFAGATGNDDGPSKVSKIISVCTIDGQSGGTIPIAGNRQSNGPGWHCSPPDGCNGVLAGFAAQLGGALNSGSNTEGGPLCSIGFIWRYDRVVPKGMTVQAGTWLTDLMAAR